MISDQLLGRVAVVLVRARNPNNIGAVARAMHDFGFSDLRVVNEYGVPLETAKSAVDASQVIADARVFASVADAVADCTLVAGTTAVGERALEHPLHALAEAAELVKAACAGEEGRVALLFGSEKTGLSNEELSHCNFLMTIPMYEHEDVRHPSMNLGQAAAVCLYELVRREGVHAGVGVRDAAKSVEIERVTKMLSDVLDETGYRRKYAHATEEEVRRLVLRMGLKAADVPVWMGILRQALWKARGGEG
ncbi:MAG: TrmH family RNA methyltransferase [Edaphobacter sp.]|uniref:RNA methyltransferase n=1 Tax=Edaphobacter sp. TaxID=1934404 RepID=UPI00238E7447|nr:TrmH family RNA methyltransferase [Edaphobacter sp.]MDE1176892.1 TrmH family RNA methyltransferase [Edaphobacter sp.]